MTTPRRDGGDTPFSAWIRSQPELDSKRYGYDLEDFDRIHSRLYTWHQFLHGELMLIEEKQYNADLTFAQFDTLTVISQALRYSFSDPSFTVTRKNLSRPTKITYFGYNIIQFEKKSPTDGGIRINYKPVTEQELLRFLQFDRHFMEERLRLTPQTVSVSEYRLLPKLKRGSRKADRLNVPTLFNPTPTQQQAFEWEAQHA